MTPEGFDILHEEGPLLIVAKPGGLLTQAPPEVDSLETRIKRFLKLRDEKPGKVYLAMAHRLDRPVSGALATAKHVRAARRICEQFEGRLVDKTYWAVVEGQVADDTGEWIDHIRKIPERPVAELVPADHIEGRRAVLRYQVLRRFPTFTWLQIELETGRMHQIRVQCAARGHAVLGDAMYGATSLFGPETVDERARWIGLHARRLALRHPMTREPVAVTAPLPAWWEQIGVVPAGDQ
ncbi:RluA family pseudouridine synthase [Lignipirellula cremea]|uniref:Ribosomal large subunit pseudouridine synthase D n=1 Tax=Lignipirellula cremea TaxID=2528010 RepID=A0A518DMU2_9BACT|nr:RNA pseudouridine synthase [Lignipirellula cremea]QDU93158.1 Ribosomal large subunit pseudouridine synthase D [Lignipirellula cremea]